MKPVNLKFSLILILFGLATYFTWNSYLKIYTQRDTINIHLFPQAIGPWVSEELPLTSDEYAILETHNAFTRKYKTPDGKEVYLFIVYSQNNRKVSHPPEICYTGGGISILNKTLIPLKENRETLRVNRLLLEQEDTQQIAYYWFKVGNQFVGNYWKQQSLIVMNTLLNQNPSSALIRISANISKEGGEAKTDANLNEFVKLIAPELFKYLP